MDDPNGLVILCNRDDLGRLRQIAPNEIVVLAIWRDARSGVLSVGDLAGETVVLKAAPSLCLGLFSFSVEGVSRLDEIARRLLEIGGFRRLAPRKLPEQADGLNVLLASEMISMLRQNAAHTVRLTGELASLRTRFEETQNAFSAFENTVSGLGLQSLRLAFENKAQDRYEIGGPGVVSIRQILPVSSVGLGSFQLQLSNRQGAAARVWLRTLEDEIVHGGWSIPAEAMESTWMTFNLSRTISGAQRTAELIISSDADGGMCHFALGKPQPIKAFRAEVSGGDQAPGRSLAMRLRVGLPGVKLPDSNEGGYATRTVQVRDFRLSRETLGSVRRITKSWDPSFSVVEALDDGRGVRCHPPEGDDITVAVFEDSVPAETCGFTAAAVVGHANAAPINFGVAFSALDEQETVARIRRGEIGDADSGYVFTGWVSAVHAAPAILRLDLVRDDGRIYLATTMANAGSNSFAWSTFMDMRFTTLTPP